MTEKDKGNDQTMINVLDCSLNKKYDDLMAALGMQAVSGNEGLYICIRHILHDFMQAHKRVAVYCYGYHTQMLMTDFVGELRDLVCIIDNGNVKEDSDFRIIKDGDIEEYELDGIIISSFKLMDEIKQGLYENHSSVDVLDMYEELEKRGIPLEHDFFYAGPYQVYSKINTLNQKIEESGSLELLKQLLKEYVGIKDFRLAGEVARRIYKLTGDDPDKEICGMIDDLYEAELDQLACSGKDNILLLCLDGMRRIDFLDGKMDKTYGYLKDRSSIFTNAYSYSTMTYESLVPVFEENSDQRTEYYLREEVPSKDCCFIKKALEEKRPVAIYGDGNHYIYDGSIKYSGNSQTVTEKLWDFVIDIEGVDNGIFYLHEMYESHYSFANPYTKRTIVSQGSAMLFDLLPQNSGHLRTDYKSQQEDALRYLDDTLAPFIKVLPCKMVLFADHGNLILENGTELKDVKEQQLHAGDDWIRIPLVIKADCVKPGVDDGLISLMSLNDIVLSIMSGKEYKRDIPEYII